MAHHVWNGHSIDVQFRLQRRVCWLAGGFVVRIDGGPKIHPPTELEADGTSTPFKIAHSGSEVSGDVRSVGRVMAMGTRYEVTVETDKVAAGCLRADNWYIPYSILLIFFVGLLLLAF